MAVRDILVVTVMLFVIGLVLFMTNMVSHRIYSHLENNSQINNTQEAITVLQSTSNAIDNFDYIFLGFFVGFFLAIIITGWFVGGNPIFSTIYFIVVVFVVVMSAIISSIWEEIVNSTSLVSTLANFPIADYIMTNLGMFMAIIGLLGLFVMFAKPSFPGEQ